MEEMDLFSNGEKAWFDLYGYGYIDCGPITIIRRAFSEYPTLFFDCEIIENDKLDCCTMRFNKIDSCARASARITQFKEFIEIHIDNEKIAAVSKSLFQD